MTSVAIDSLRLHPDAERVPLADHGDLRQLRESLQEHGQQDPIDICGDVILDGRTRWTLLKQLGFMEVQVREVDIPDAQQTDYIVDRALSRRHLTAEQKRALNALLRQVVVEVVEHKGEEVRVGMSMPERAAKLGVTNQTIKTWDAQERSGRNLPDPEAPTHVRRSGGNTGLIPARMPKSETVAAPTPIRPERLGRASNTAASTHGGRPLPWRRHFTKWCRGALAEDRPVLLAMSTELHHALRLIGEHCEMEGVADGAA